MLEGNKFSSENLKIADHPELSDLDGIILLIPILKEDCLRVWTASRVGSGDRRRVGL